MKRTIRQLARHLLLAGLFAGTPLMPVANANLLTNGSFEAPDITTGTYAIFSQIPGWTTSFGDGIEVQDQVAGSPYAGTQHVELDVFTNSGIRQQIATVATHSYRLSFAYSPRPGIEADSNLIEVYFNNALIDTITRSGLDLPDTSWSVFTYNVAATGPTTALEFRAGGLSNGYGGYLDDVQLTATPEPATLALLGSGLVVLGRFHNRRPQRA